MFKIGDRVKCIKVTEYEPERYGVVGQVYTIATIYDEASITLVGLTGRPMMSRFELYTDPEIVLNSDVKEEKTETGWGI